MAKLKVLGDKLEDLFQMLCELGVITPVKNRSCLYFSLAEFGDLINNLETLEIRYVKEGRLQASKLGPHMVSLEELPRDDVLHEMLGIKERSEQKI
jgi:hypothetical protein